MDENVRTVFSIISIIRAEDEGIDVRLPVGPTYSFYSKACRPVPDLPQPHMQCALVAVSSKVK